MKRLALVYVTPLFSLLSLSKLVPNVSSSLPRRYEIARVCASELERERGRGRDMMVWEKGCSGLTVSSGLRWKQAFGQMTSFQPVFHIPASLLAWNHKTHHHSTYHLQ